MLRARFSPAVALALAVATLAVAQAQQGRSGSQEREAGQRPRGGGPPGVFRTDVPAHDLDVIQARPTDSSVTLSLLAAKNLSVTLSYESGGAPRPIALEAGVPSRIEVTGLSPGRSYRYSVAAATTLASGTFRTAAAPSAPFTFAVQADSHLDGNTDPKVLREDAGEHRGGRAPLPGGPRRHLHDREVRGLPGLGAAVPWRSGTTSGSSAGRCRCS